MKMISVKIFALITMNLAKPLVPIPKSDFKLFAIIQIVDYVPLSIQSCTKQHQKIILWVLHGIPDCCTNMRVRIRF